MIEILAVSFAVGALIGLAAFFVLVVAEEIID